MTDKQNLQFQIKKLTAYGLNNVWIWILLFFLIRLIGITNPPLEMTHNWRQVTGLMVARNFLEVDNNILYPRIDDNGGQTGIIGMEFPTLNYLHYVVAIFFGHAHWYGRLINLIVSSLGIFYYSKIIGRFFNHKIVFASTLFLLCSIWFSFSRKMMPDTYCVSIMFAAIFYGVYYLENGTIWRLILFSTLASVAILSKIPSGIYFGLLLPLIFSNYEVKRKILLSTSIACPLIVMYLWYFIWCPFLSLEYGNWFNSGRTFSVGFSEISTNFSQCLENFYFHSFKSYIIFSLVIIGLCLMFIQKNKCLILTILPISLVFLVYMVKSGYFFYHHDYYIVPIVPLMALVAGYAISLRQNKWIFGLLVFAGISEGILNQYHDFITNTSDQYKLNISTIANTVSSEKDLIVINGNGNPQQIYLAHRKGWICNDYELTDSLYLNTLSNQNAKYLFVNKHTTNPTISKVIVYTDNNYTVYDLTKQLQNNLDDDNQPSSTNSR